MYCPSLSMVSILLEDCDGFSPLGDDLGCSINYLESIDLMVINTCDINFLQWVDIYNISIIANDSTICSPIN